MNKNTRRARAALVLLLAVLLAVSGCSRTPSAPPRPTESAIHAAAAMPTEPAGELVSAWENKSALCSYNLALQLDPDAHRMNGTLNFTYVNTEDRAMPELHFLLYANSYGSEQYGIFEEDQVKDAYPNGFSPGGISVEDVSCGGKQLVHDVEGSQNQVLRVRLPQPVAPGSAVKLTITYSVTVPNCLGRFGYGPDTMSLVNCNPILSVYDGGQWHDYPYYAMGDPFYSETADYTATITAPKSWTIAATGRLTSRSDGQNTTWTVDAPGRRDFGLVASDKFKVLETVKDGVTVRSYYINGDDACGREALNAGAEALGLYDETFGKYPFQEFSVVEADFFIGGMEYPGMVLIDSTEYKSDSAAMLLDLIVAHETGHQWWYSVVGNDEVMEPWLDEGLTEFTTQYFFERERSREYNNYYAQMIDDYRNFRARQQGQYAADMPSFAYPDGTTYSAWVYDRTAAVLTELRKKIGDEAFFSALKQYYQTDRLKVATGTDLENAFSKAAGQDLSGWFEKEMSEAGN